MNSPRLWITTDSNASFRIPRKRLEKALLQIIAKLKKKLKGRSASVELHFVRSPAMKKMNFKYRGRNQSTDILSFDSFAPGLLGSLVIDLDTAKKQSKEYHHSLDQEITELFIHGVLHLLGFDHETERDAKVMARHERHFINLC